MAPAALARCSTLPRSHPASRPWASEPPKLSPAPSPLTRHRDRRRLDALAVAGLAEHALRALLDDGDLDAGVEQRVGGAFGVGLADRDLALLAVADGDGDLAEDLLDLEVAVAASAQNIGR